MDHFQPFFDDFSVSAARKMCFEGGILKCMAGKWAVVGKAVILPDCHLHFGKSFEKKSRIRVYATDVFVR